MQAAFAFIYMNNCEPIFYQFSISMENNTNYVIFEFSAKYKSKQHASMATYVNMLTNNYNNAIYQIRYVEFGVNVYKMWVFALIE